MKFYLGTHMVSKSWWDLSIPLFVSRNRLAKRKTFHRAREGWALDSGGFTELSLYGEWRTSETEYVSDVRRFQAEIGRLDWVAPQDWMCEPHMLSKTGLTVSQHQSRTVDNFLRLREELGLLVIPVLQGFSRDDYLICWDRYIEAGVDLASEPVVGLGTICRRQSMAEAGRIVRSLDGLCLHGFGVKITGLYSFADALSSADSMAWSYAGRRNPLATCTHTNCANCMRYALRWRDQVLAGLAQQRMEIHA